MHAFGRMFRRPTSGRLSGTVCHRRLQSYKVRSASRVIRWGRGLNRAILRVAQLIPIHASWSRFDVKATTFSATWRKGKGKGESGEG